MNNARTIAALERTIAQLTAVKDRLVAAEAKSALAPIKKSAGKKSTAKKVVAKRTMSPEHKASISAAQKRRFALSKSPAKKRAAKKTS